VKVRSLSTRLNGRYVGDYRPATCSYCNAGTWCERRSDGTPQCRACKIERFFERVLYPPLGYKLQEWQRKILRALYGTVDAGTGLRQYRRSYISVAKQNGKSFLLGGLPIYHLLMENEPQPEAYGVASARDQASIVYKAAALLVEGNPELRKRLKVLESTRRIIRRDGGGLYTVLSADGDVQDGKRPSLLMFDELHRFTRKKAETVRTVLLKGMISRSPVVNGVQQGEPLMIQTTTSGDEHECPLWFSEYEYAQHVLDGSIEDRSYYAAIYQADPKRIESDPEYWKSREARVAANPSHEDNGGFLADSAIEAEMKEAVARPEKYGGFVRLNLNVPCVLTGTPVIQMPLWCQGGGGVDLREWPVYDVERLISQWGLAGKTCFAGIDLAWTTDMAALAFLFPPSDDIEQWKELLFFWLPTERISDIERRTRAPLTSWAQRGFLETNPGAEIDMSAVIERVRWASQEFDLREVCFDRWGGIKAAANLLLVREGFTCVEIAQTIGGLTAATKNFFGLYMNRKLAHGNNPILNWHASCLALVTDGGDNCKPAKPARDTASKRIDGVAATITAMARAQFAGDQGISYSPVYSLGV
jgi:phage terminase large subunit-like protein